MDFMGLYPLPPMSSFKYKSVAKQGMPNRTWKELLTQTDNLQIAEVYDDLKNLTASVTHFIQSGLSLGESVVVIATPEHWEIFHRQLAQKGTDIESWQRTDRLIVLNAHTCLLKFMSEERPDWNYFRTVISEPIEKARAASPLSKVRAYGEMVNILWRERNIAGAQRLEELWKELSKINPFSLFCSYEGDPFNKDFPDDILEHICTIHSKVNFSLTRP